MAMPPAAAATVAAVTAAAMAVVVESVAGAVGLEMHLCLEPLVSSFFFFFLFSFRLHAGAL